MVCGKLDGDIARLLFMPGCLCIETYVHRGWTHCTLFAAVFAGLLVSWSTNAARGTCFENGHRMLYFLMLLRA